MGCMYQEYTQVQHALGQRLSPAVITSNGISYLVGRVSYTFGLQGANEEAGAGLVAAPAVTFAHALAPPPP